MPVEPASAAALRPRRPSLQLSDDDISQDIPEIIPVFVGEDDSWEPHQVPEQNEESDLADTLRQLEVLVDRAADRQRAKRPVNDVILLPDDDDNDSNTITESYDFENNDPAAGLQEGDADDDGDSVYYSDDEARFPVETIFDRRERLDVKKPGPFYANSQNNFFLDKVLQNIKQSPRHFYYLYSDRYHETYCKYTYI